MKIVVVVIISIVTLSLMAEIRCWSTYRIDTQSIAKEFNDIRLKRIHVPDMVRE
jgi:hypothetical protein|tara:strand:+ start:1979 stop:2140 length:162 start_codon:yes stop_codon:yes gene_type:complete